MPAAAAVRVTVAPVSRVTVTVLPIRTDSFVVAVMLIVWVALYEPFAVDVENDEIVGATVSTVMVVPDVDAVAGPVLPAASVAPPRAKRGITVPSLHPVIVTVRMVLDMSVPGVKTQLSAVPVFEKSTVATPVTASEKVIVYVNDVELVGVD